MDRKTSEEQLITAAYRLAVTGMSLDDMAWGLREGYDRGRREYLDNNPHIRAKIMAEPEPEEDICLECGNDGNAEPTLYDALLHAASNIDLKKN